MLLSMDYPTDTELVAAARSGDVAGFGVLIERHRARMLAVAVSLLGWNPGTEDVVQDASIIAMRRLDQLRDPAAAGPWLMAITRNAARMRLRTPDRETPVDLLTLERAHPGPSPEEILDGHAFRDWVWSAVNELSEPLQVPLLLRYFTPATSYEQMAAVCDVPVRTVRSRWIRRPAGTRRSFCEGAATVPTIDADTVHADAVEQVAEGLLLNRPTAIEALAAY